jgi:hypothetical protein
VAIDSDNQLSLPTPPPPRPAARREAIDAALRKFDGIEETPAARRPSWLGIDRRAFGALATAAIVAVISVPIALDALRDLPQPAQQQASPPVVADVAGPAPQAPAASDNLTASEPAADQAGSPVVPEEKPTPEQPAEARQAEAKRERIGLVANEQDARSEPPPPALAVAAPPPPPPPPPPAPAAPAARGQQYAADSATQDVVVSGSRISRSNLEGGAPLKAIDTYGDFLSRLQAALRTDDRRAVSRLVGFPLSVRKDGKVETYRSRREVERDFDEIFTPRVRSEVLDQRPYSLRTRQDGKTKGSTRIWFAPACFNAECTPPGQIRIREVTP